VLNGNILADSRRILVTGGTGYLGQCLLPLIVLRGHLVRALARPESIKRVPAGVQAMAGDALNEEDVVGALRFVDTVVHLVGVAKPSPRKAKQFRTVDLESVRVLTQAIAASGAQPHVVYVSVAQPAPVMRAYVAARQEAEGLIRAANVPATFIRPWYVLGPQHQWPALLSPVYSVARLLPFTRATAQRLALVTIDDMMAALLQAIERPIQPGVTVVDVPAILAAGRAMPASQQYQAAPRPPRR
jgi:uncharacterized protein YbjT (DUF2867 family)